MLFRTPGEGAAPQALTLSPSARRDDRVFSARTGGAVAPPCCYCLSPCPP
uniref:Uncharacterized protein n=1 Tax=Leclercia adecarboxylata TaxID=83655 RepID=A0A6H0A3P1_9ENTR|nr:hypothetical protein [Leclercia adecarboxylata]